MKEKAIYIGAVVLTAVWGVAAPGGFAPFLLQPVCFAEDVKYADYIFKADKPSVKGYEEAMRRMGTTKETTLFIGDQLFTDVWGAKRSGIRSILVKPIHPKEEIQIIFKRQLEKIVLHFYYRQKSRKEMQ